MKKISLRPITNGASKSQLITAGLTSPPYAHFFCMTAGIHPGLEETNTPSWQSTRLLLISWVYRAEGQLAGPFMCRAVHCGSGADAPAPASSRLSNIVSCLLLRRGTRAVKNNKKKTKKKKTKTARRERIAAGEKGCLFFF